MSKSSPVQLPHHSPNSSRGVSVSTASYYLERKSARIPLGSLALGNFFPYMPFTVFEILVRENNFSIHDDMGNEYSLLDFVESINYSYNNTSVPVIPLGSV